ncbi:ribokinase [Paenibacillus humicola]|uniref:ribokinase n=1 Tax=Paenibacillus humicola TaxID=3110540 RepID=UPI00237B679A|nr:ribokinase [Paenibacillus humicola]
MKADPSDIVVFGTIDMDYVCFVDRFPDIGETVTTSDFGQFPGGKAANQAVAAARLGSRVSLVGRVGEDETGRQLKAQMEAEGVNHDFVHYTPGWKTGISMIQVDRDGRNTVVTYPGASARWTKEDIDRAEAKIRQAKYVILQIEMDLEVARHLIRTVRQAGVKLILNLAPVVALDPESLSMVDILIVNETESSQLTGMTVHSVETAHTAAQMLVERGVRQVVITLGEAGAVVKDNALFVYAPSRKVKAVDTTAAGDCFVAAAAHFLSKGEKLAEAVRMAAEVAALSVTKTGAQTSLPTYEEYIKWREEK